MTTQTVENRNRRLARSTLIVIVAFGVAKVISLVQTVILANTFGLGAEMDSYLAANNIPETIFNFVFSGYLETIE